MTAIGNFNNEAAQIFKGFTHCLLTTMGRSHILKPTNDMWAPYQEIVVPIHFKANQHGINGARIFLSKLQWRCWNDDPTLCLDQFYIMEKNQDDWYELFPMEIGVVYTNPCKIKFYIKR